MKTRTRARSRHVEQRTCEILLRVICAIFDSRCAGVVCPGMGFAKCPRVACAWVWDSPGVSGMPCRDHPGVFAVVSGVCEKGGGTCGVPSLSRFGCGGVLLSHTLPGAVPSPCQVLASGFGMGPGVSPGPWPPQIFNCHPTGSRGGSWWVGDRIVDATEGLIHVTCRVSPCRPLSMFAPAALYGRVCVLPFDC